MSNRTFKDLVYVVNSTADTTGGTWMKYGEVGGSANRSTRTVWTHAQRKRKCLPFLMLWLVRLGLEPSLCSPAMYVYVY